MKGRNVCAIYVYSANVFWPQCCVTKASNSTLDIPQKCLFTFLFYKSLTFVHFILSTPKEEGNTPASVDSIINVKGRLSDDDFDIRTPIREGNATVKSLRRYL